MTQDDLDFFLWALSGFVAITGAWFHWGLVMLCGCGAMIGFAIAIVMRHGRR